MLLLQAINQHCECSLKKECPMSTTLRSTLLSTLVLSLLSASIANAGLFKQSASGQVAKVTLASATTAQESLPAPPTVQPRHFPKYCISYRNHPLLGPRTGSCGTMKIALAVPDPACCKYVVEVPVCIPCCCTDVPKVHSRCGVLGRRIVVYDWCCGYKVRVVFNRCNDVVVHSYGR